MTARRHGDGSVWSKPTLKNWYISFYADGRRHQVNTKLPSTPENRPLAEKILSQEMAKVTLGQKSDLLTLRSLRYEDLRDHLVERLKSNGKASVYRGADGTDKVVGSRWLDEYFKGMTLDKMADRLPAYPQWVMSRKETQERISERVEKEAALLQLLKQYPKRDAEVHAKRIAEAAVKASINRSLSTLRSMYSRYAKDFGKKLSLSDIPTMPRFESEVSDNVGQGFISLETYEKIKKAMPDHLRPLLEFQYFTGMRSGAAQQITWSMVVWDKNVPVELVIPANLMKNRENWRIPLVGVLEPIAKTLRDGDGFRGMDVPIFNAVNFRREWNRACASLGLGLLDKETQNYHGMHPHDMRRSAARNLIRAGVSQSVAMAITGHKTPAMFRRYDITDSSDVADALQRVAKFAGASAPQKRAQR